MKGWWWVVVDGGVGWQIGSRLLQHFNKGAVGGRVRRHRGGDGTQLVTLVSSEIVTHSQFTLICREISGEIS